MPREKRNKKGHHGHGTTKTPARGKKSKKPKQSTEGPRNESSPEQPHPIDRVSTETPVVTQNPSTLKATSTILPSRSDDETTGDYKSVVPRAVVTALGDSEERKQFTGNCRSAPSESKFRREEVETTELDGKDKKDPNHRNVVLRAIKALRRGSAPIKGMLSIVVETTRDYHIPDLPCGESVNTRNRHWTAVMTAAHSTAQRKNIAHDPAIFRVVDSTGFTALMSEGKFGEIATDTFETHLATTASQSAADPQKKENYENMMAHYYELRRRRAAITEFDEPLTAAEEKFMNRIEANMSRTTGYATHYQNENANCYLGLMIHIFSLFDQDAKDLMDYDSGSLCNIFYTLCCYAHNKLHESFDKAQTWFSQPRTTELAGVNLARFWSSVLGSGLFHDGKQQNRNVDNGTLTMERLLRVTTLVTGLPSLWGISLSFHHGLLPELYELWRLECWLETGVKKSHSICWYLALNRATLISPMHDRQDLSGETIIGTAVQRYVRPIVERPNGIPFFAGRENPCLRTRAEEANARMALIGNTDNENSEDSDG